MHIGLGIGLGIWQPHKDDLLFYYFIAIRLSTGPGRRYQLDKEEAELGHQRLLGTEVNSIQFNQSMVLPLDLYLPVYTLHSTKLYNFQWCQI